MKSLNLCRIAQEPLQAVADESPPAEAPAQSPAASQAIDRSENPARRYRTGLDDSRQTSPSVPSRTSAIPRSAAAMTGIHRPTAGPMRLAASKQCTEPTVLQARQGEPAGKLLVLNIDSFLQLLQRRLSSLPLSPELMTGNAVRMACQAETEQVNYTICDHARSRMKDPGTPNDFWMFFSGGYNNLSSVRLPAGAKQKLYESLPANFKFADCAPGQRAAVFALDGIGSSPPLLFLAVLSRYRVVNSSIHRILFGDAQSMQCSIDLFIAQQRP